MKAKTAERVRDAALTGLQARIAADPGSVLAKAADAFLKADARYVLAALKGSFTERRVRGIITPGAVANKMGE